MDLGSDFLIILDLLKSAVLIESLLHLNDPVEHDFVHRLELFDSDESHVGLVSLESKLLFKVIHAEGKLDLASRRHLTDEVAQFLNFFVHCGQKQGVS